MRKLDIKIKINFHYNFRIPANYENNFVRGII